MTTSTNGTEDVVGSIVAAFRAQLSNPANPLALLVRFRVADGDQHKVESAFDVARVQTALEEGVISFSLHREAADANRFVVYEQWRSLADLEAHLRTPYIMLLREQFDGLIVGAPEFHVLVPLASLS